MSGPMDSFVVRSKRTHSVPFGLDRPKTRHKQIKLTDLDKVADLHDLECLQRELKQITAVPLTRHTLKALLPLLRRLADIHVTVEALTELQLGRLATSLRKEVKTKFRSHGQDKITGAGLVDAQDCNRTSKQHPLATRTADPKHQEDETEQVLTLLKELILKWQNTVRVEQERKADPLNGPAATAWLEGDAFRFKTLRALYIRLAPEFSTSSLSIREKKQQFRAQGRFLDSAAFLVATEIEKALHAAHGGNRTEYTSAGRVVIAALRTKIQEQEQKHDGDDKLEEEGQKHDWHDKLKEEEDEGEQQDEEEEVRKPPLFPTSPSYPLTFPRTSTFTSFSSSSSDSSSGSSSSSSSNSRSSSSSKVDVE
eukprot:gb/GEZN01010910.1/.p1 GENE.gb/GEZN01010910.1/~~gb/GEZN01010910.1/.p1  ORF type:complete len:367 (-),score=105.39 gb/GEZN01010910.1/:49-1149(-)